MSSLTPQAASWWFWYEDIAEETFITFSRFIFQVIWLVLSDLWLNRSKVMQVPQSGSELGYPVNYDTLDILAFLRVLLRDISTPISYSAAQVHK